ncbi:choice-of-anchor D domain-containing protein [Deferrisoma sp.]
MRSMREHMGRFLAIALVAGTLVGCGTSGGDSGSVIPPPEEPSAAEAGFSVSPKLVETAAFVGYAQSVTLEVTNLSDTPHRVDEIALVDAAAGFSLAETTCPPVGGVLEAGASCTVKVAFTPEAQGTDTATVRVTLDGTTLSASIRCVVADPPSAEVVSSSLDFGQVRLGEKKTLTATIQNDGPGVLEVSGPSVVLGDEEAEAAPFEVALGENCGAVSPGEACSITVTFSPTARVAYEASLSVTTNDPEYPEGTVVLTGTGVAPKVAVVSPNDLKIDFGETTIGSTAEQTLTVKNDGNADLSLGFETSSPAFTVTPEEATLVPGQTRDITVRFAPTVAGGYEGSLTLTTNDPDQGSETIALEGEGVIPVAELREVDTPEGSETPALDLGSTNVGAAVARTFTVANVGKGLLSVSAAIEPAGGPFAVTLRDAEDEGCAGLAEGEACTVEVTFVPTGYGEQGATLTLTTNDPDDGSFTVALRGAALEPALAVGTFVAPAAEVGAEATVEIPLENTGEGTLKVTAAAVEPADGPFDVALEGCEAVAPGGSCTARVTFSPTSYADDDAPARVTLTWNAPDGEAKTVNVAAKVLEPALTVGTFDAPAAEVGAEATVEIPLENTGEGTLKVTAAAVEPADGPFDVALEGCEAVAPGGSCTAKVTFSPTSYADDDAPARVTLTWNAPDGQAETVTVTAKVLEPDVAWDIGAILPTRVGERNTVQVSVRNEGEGTLSVSSASVSGADFRILEDGCSGNTVAPDGEPCGITVEFNPSGHGTRTGTLTITTNDPDEATVTVSLSGTGQAPDVSVSPATLSLADTAPGSESAAGTLTVTNEGNLALTVSSVTLAGADAAEFVIASETCTGASVAADGTCEVQVVFAPRWYGAKTAEVRLATDDPDEPEVVVEVTATSPVGDVTLTETGSFQWGDGTLVRVDFTAEDTSGTTPVPVLGLGLGDLTLTLDGADAGDFTSAELIGQAALDLAVVIDESDGAVLPMLQGAAEELVAYLEAVTGGDVNAVYYGYGAEVRRLGSASAASEQAGGWKSLYEGLWAALEGAGVDGPAQDLVVVLTGDGEDNHSDPAALTAVEAAVAGGKRVYGLVYGDVADLGATDLASISTDVTVVAGGDPRAENDVYAALLGAVEASYALYFRQPDRAAAHDLGITATVTGVASDELVHPIAPVEPPVGGLSFTTSLDADAWPLEPEVGSDGVLALVEAQVLANPLSGLRSTAFSFVADEEVWFEREPLDVAVVVDTSESVSQASVLAEYREAARLLVAALGEQTEATVTLYRVDGSGASPVGSVEELTASVEDAGFTKLLDGIRTVAASRRVVVLLTDGRDNQSTAALAEVQAELRSKGVVVHALGYGSSVDAATLRGLSDDVNVGGAYWEALSAQELYGQALNVADALSGLYRLRYHPPAGVGPVAGVELQMSYRGEEAQGSLVGAASIEPASHDFGSVLVGATPAERTFTVRNTGDQALVVTGVSVGDATLEVTGETCTAAPVAVGGTCTVTVSYAPAVGSLALASALTVATTSPATPEVTAEVTGAGQVADIAVEVTSAFGSVKVDESTSGVVTVTNNGDGTLTVTSVSVDPAGEFAVSSETCTTDPDGLATGDTCTVNLTFTPSDQGTRTAQLVVASNDPTAPEFPVTLTGTGIVPDIAVSPATVSFGDVRKGETSAEQTVTVTNTGAADLVLGAVTVSGAGFAIGTDGCGGQTLAQGESCEVKLTVTPGALGALTGTLAIASDDPDENPLEVTLTATGVEPDIAVAPATVTFGATAVGETAGPEVVTVTNEGTSALSITSVTTSSEEEFPITTTCGATLAAGASCEVRVSFAPASHGARTGTLTITTDDPDEGTVTVSLSGTGQAPDVSVSPATLSLADTAPGSESAAATLTVTNEGNLDLAVSSVTLAGADAAEFVIASETCTGSSVAAGGTCEVHVTFAPMSYGSKKATLTISSNDPDQASTSVAVSATSAPGSLVIANTQILARSDTTEATILFEVRDDAGDPIVGIDTNALSVTVDGAPAPDPVEFERYGALNLGIVIDAASGNGSFNEMLNDASVLVSALSAWADVHVTVYTYDDEIQNVGSDPASATKGTQDAHRMYEALKRAVDGAPDSFDETRNDVVVVFSETGDDDASDPGSLSALESAISTYGARLYGVVYAVTPGTTDLDGVTGVVDVQRGGEGYAGFNRIAAQVATDIDPVYTVRLTQPDKTSDHTIAVTATLAGVTSPAATFALSPWWPGPPAPTILLAGAAMAKDIVQLDLGNPEQDDVFLFQVTAPDRAGNTLSRVTRYLGLPTEAVTISESDGSVWDEAVVDRLNLEVEVLVDGSNTAVASGSFWAYREAARLLENALAGLPRVLVSFTRIDGQTTGTGFGSASAITPDGGDTNLFDPIEGLITTDDSHQKILVVLSDGIHNAPGATNDLASTQAVITNRRTVVHTLALNPAPAFEGNLTGLSSGQPFGGTHASATTPQGLYQGILDVVGWIASTYRWAYTSPNAAGARPDLQLCVTLNGETGCLDGTGAAAVPLVSRETSSGGEGVYDGSTVTFEPSEGVTFHVMNTGGAEIDFGANPLIITSNGFVLDPGTCGAKLDHGATCSFSVTAPGAYDVSDTVTVVSGALAFTVQVPVKPEPLAGTWDGSDGTPAYDFGIVDQTTGSARFTFTFENVAGKPVTVTSVGLATNAVFEIGPENCENAVLDPNERCSVVVTYTPDYGSGFGSPPDSDTLEIGWDDGSDTGTISKVLKGAPFPVAVNDGGVPANSVDLGVVPVDGNSYGAVVTLRNYSTDPVGISAVGPPDNSKFTVRGGTDTCTGASLEANGDSADSCTLVVDATLAQSDLGGVLSGNLPITLTDGSTANVALKATPTPLSSDTPGGNPEDLPLTYDFDDDWAQVRLNPAVGSYTKIITITNNDGATPVVIGSVTLADGTHFAVSDDCTTAPIGAGGTCAVTVEAAPTGPGVQTDTVRIQETTYGTTLEIDASVTARALVIAPDDPSNHPAFDDTSAGFVFDYGLAPIGGWGAVQTFEVTNTHASTNYTISAVTPPTNWQVDAEDCTSAPIGPGNTCTIDLRFLPDANGAEYGGDLTVVSNSGADLELPLSGKGTALGVFPLTGEVPAAYDFAATGKSEQLFTVSNVSGGSVTLDPVSVTGNFTRSEDGCSGQELSPVNGTGDCTLKVTPTGSPGDTGTLTIPYGATSVTVGLSQ